MMSVRLPRSFRIAGRGEYLMTCPRCGARNFVLVGGQAEPPA